MSIDVFIHTTIDVAAAQAQVDRLRAEHPDLFPEHFLLYDASAPDDYDTRFLKRDFNFDVTSTFIVHLANKRRADLADTVLLVGSYFGDGETVALYENETVFPSTS